MKISAMALCLCALWCAGAQAACRQALAVGLDVSGSVDTTEYRLQLDGLAAALEDAEVQAAFLAMPQAPVRLMLFEWSGLRDQRILADWQTITAGAQLSAIAADLRRTGIGRAKDPSTAIVAAMVFGARAALDQAACWQKTVDISGDGPGNIGRHPRDLTEADLGAVTINGLVIGPQSRANTSKNLQNVKSLEGYYRNFVLRGPGAFAEVARDHADFAAAMKRKLIREIQAPILSGMTRPGPAQ